MIKSSSGSYCAKGVQMERFINVSESTTSKTLTPLRIVLGLLSVHGSPRKNRTQYADLSQ